MNPTTKRFLIRTLEESYKINEIANDNFKNSDGELILLLKDYELDKWNNQRSEISFENGANGFTINGWSFTEPIEVIQHFRGRYENTLMTIKCVSPDGLKVPLRFVEEVAVPGVIEYLLSKLWFTLCKEAKDLDFLKIDD